ncbi:uncharacterized protein LOC111069951 [Drosophila obscura]|uniref:uncharacterized protein LOC111069951 n=1 Tax=Drosophila obscura TaxID=7282 RepID=UPI001BB1E630|nr:uncharacterized protein LOC111069951 [Drosophila obscura]
MYKHTVKSKLAHARSQPPPAAADTTLPTSSKHGLGAGKKFFSHIRHKIEDNLSPKLGGKLYYKGSKHTRSMSALSLQVDGGCIGGKYTPKAVAPPAATPLKMEQVSPQMSSSVCSYVDSDEESHLSLSLSLTQQSLEDEIFAELEKVAHDESKLNEVLQSFDQILSEYPPVEEIRETPPTEEVLAAPPAAFCDRQMLLSKSHSSLSMGRAKRQIYQSPELATSMLLRRSDSTSNGNSRYNSLSELNGSRIPVSKHSSLRKRSESFCLDQPLNHRSSKQRTRSMLTLNSGITGRSSALNTGRNTAAVAVAVPVKAKAKACSGAAPLPPKRANSTLEKRQMHSSRPGGPRRANSTLRATTAHSDELLVKCLAKGHEILRQVENISAKPKRSSSRGVTKEHSQLARNKKRHQQKLQYANEEKVGKPKLESCKIIPPKLGETSDRNQELLVKVVQAVNAKAKARGKDSPPLKKPLKQEKEQQQQQQQLEPSSDSDDSGHISNTVLSTSTSTCNSTGSLCESEGDEAEEPSAVKKSNKIAELLQKFEAVAAAAAAVKSNPPSIPAPAMIATKVVAQVQAVRCIQTQVEIYPNYTKEVTMRLH